MSLKMMNTQIYFNNKADNTQKLLQRGILAMLLKADSDKKYCFDNYEDALKVLKEDKVDAKLTPEGKIALELAFKGAYRKPYKVYIGFSKNDDNIENAVEQFASVKFDWLVAPEHKASHAKISEWIKKQNEENNLEVKAVLVGDGFDCKEVVSFDTDGIVLKNMQTISSKNPSVSKELMTVGIASALCGTPLTRSLSNLELDYVEKVNRLSNSEYDAKVSKGKLILYNDWDIVRVGRAVNSLQTLDGQSEELKKIFIVSKMHLWKREVKDIISEQYLGAKQNGIDEKMMLVSSIKMYNKELAKKGIILNKDGGFVDIDVEAQNNWLRNEKGVDTSDWSEKKIRDAKTGSNVFITASFEFSDAMEDIKISVNNSGV